MPFQQDEAQKRIEGGYALTSQVVQHREMLALAESKIHTDHKVVVAWMPPLRGLDLSVKEPSSNQVLN